MSKTLAYLAGVIDSDGCITIKRRRVKTAAQWNMQAVIFVRQVSDEAITLLHSTFGGRVRSHPSSTPGGRPLFHWEVERVKAAAAARKLLPYLRIKSRQARILIAFARFVAEAKNRRAVHRFRWVPGEPCYSISEAATVKGCSAATIYQAISNKTIPSRLIPGRGHGRRQIPKRFWDAYLVRKGCRNLASEYIAERDTFRAAIHSLNGPTKGVRTADRLRTA